MTVQNVARAKQLLAQRIIPAVKFERPEHAKTWTEIFAEEAHNAGIEGKPVVELLARNAQSAASLAEMARVDGVVLGLGSIRGPESQVREMFKMAADHNCKFAVTPGTTQLQYAIAREFPDIDLFPGTSTGGEWALAAQEIGEDAVVKLFPAAVVGGPKLVTALRGPYPNITVMATGGVTEANTREYLATPGILAIGTSAVAPDALIKEGKWDEVRTLIRRNLALRNPAP